MSENLILDYPVLRENTGDFLQSISYQVKAEQLDKKLKIEHCIQGNSFILSLLHEKEAKFSVLLYYADSSERQFFTFDGELSLEKNKVTAKQIIAMDFSYAPVIIPSVVLVQDKLITITEQSGLTDFWKVGDSFKISAYSRIAIHDRLSFQSGAVSSLIEVVCNPDFDVGTMKTDVNPNAGEIEKPVKLTCASDVFDQLHFIKQAEPQTPTEAMRSAIITQALCAIYSELHSYTNTDSEILSSVLLAHSDILKEKIGTTWGDDNFNSCLAATKMQPYITSVLKNENDYE